MKDIGKILNDYLKENGYGGLYLSGECACEVDDLVPCGGDPTDCCPGYKVMKDCNDLYAFEIVEKKPTEPEYKFESDRHMQNTN